jgi:ADP-heptose:LPS heptosyltransferase
MRVVVLRARGLAAFLTGVPAYRAIARAFPDAERILAAPRALERLLPLVGDVFHRVHETEPLAPLDVTLHHADVAVDLHGRGPASQKLLLAAHPGRLISFRNERIPATAAGAPWYAREHDVDRWCRMLVHAGIAADPADLALHAPGDGQSAAGATIVHPGAASASRRWPVERWAQVIRSERRAGRRVVVTGGIADRGLGGRLARLADLPDADLLTGTTTLGDLAGLVATAGRVVCGDTGIAHLATAYGTPSVVLFGPVSPLDWGPPAGRSRHRILWRGRTGDAHGDRPDPGLLEISAGDVIDALRDLDRVGAVAV